MSRLRLKIFSNDPGIILLGSQSKMQHRPLFGGDPTRTEFSFALYDIDMLIKIYLDTRARFKIR